MTITITEESIFSLSKHNRLQWEPAQNKHVILYPEGMVELNDSSAAILELCDGSNTFLDIVNTLEERYATQGIGHEISNFLTTALEKNWISLKS